MNIKNHTILILMMLCFLPLSIASPNQQRGVHLNNQGFALAQQGQYQQAISLYQQALPDLTATDAKTQINRAATLNNLGVAYMHQRNLQDAYYALSEALSLREQYLGMLDALTLLSRHNLAVILLSGNQNKLACEHMQQAYSGRLKVLGQQHENTQLSLKFLKQIPNC
ncbi:MULTISPECIES: tetratricopeptide repeat protein [Vitreoscilla]|uniref:Tetratricopeptide repeat protein n=1 Tax=Vitreoscilla stercoraria TaxID=61 RepID=A0ABY4E760_VITST|nr:MULTISPECIES: tetratricopeptide repeat protein [Vitreoscilla]AUZ04701.1 hypothetical protein ADP71_09920 [Vitreoscilla sp. C1]UOO91613.1 tetratricopeptide repeat protein [Vitreoscilla stercoraria]